MKTLVIGLGNPVLGDDGVGWRVAEALEKRLGNSSADDTTEIVFLSLGGLSLMENMIGYDRVILIDAINTGDGVEGSVYTIGLDDIPNMASSHLGSSHDTSLQNALRVGRSLGASLPHQIHIVAIETRNLYEFSEELSTPIRASIEPAVQAVIKLLEQQN